MDMAKPAPRVGAAVAEQAEVTEAATTDAARPSRPVAALQAQKVEPALAGLDPRSQAPPQIYEPLPGELSQINVAALRGTTGADFEGRAAVLRGAPEKNILKKRLPLFFDERDFVAYGEVLRYVLIKGDCCFVFAEEKDPAPLYAIPLDGIKPKLEDPKRPDPDSVTISPTANAKRPREEMVTVLFKYTQSGKQAYQFTFDTRHDKSLAKRFLDVVEQNVLKSCRRGGSRVTASVVTANHVGKAAAKTQPMI